MYVAMDFLVFIVFHLMDTVVLIVIYRDFLCYLSIDHEVAINLSWVDVILSNYVRRFSSRFDEQTPAIVGFAYQEAENDPRHFGYLWVARGPTALQSMYVTFFSQHSSAFHARLPVSK